MKIVVTMTSWKKRIDYVAKSIYRFLSSTTIKPDIFYLWLAEEEFPNKEDDLPEDLLLTCEGLDVRICWTKENEYCFKRWRVYPKHMNDMVMSIDDDQIYDPCILEKALKRYNDIQHPCILSYQEPGEVDLTDSQYKFKKLRDYTKISAGNFFLGQTIFAPNSFPVEIFSDENWGKIRKYCPKCDESVLHPFLVNSKIPIAFISEKQLMNGITEMQQTGLLHEMWGYVKIDGHKYYRSSILKNMVLNVFPFLQKGWKEIFPNYDFNRYGHTVDELKRFCDNNYI